MEKLKSQYVNSKILLIDDDMTNNLFVESILYNRGYRQIKSITDSRLVEDVFITYKPDLILLDLQMPYMNGFEVLKKLQVLNKSKIFPIIMITVKNDTISKNHAFNLGIQHFIEKPLNTIELLTKIEHMLRINWLYNQATQQKKSIEKHLIIQKRRAIDMEDNIIDSLSLSVKFRSQETGDHINRVSNLVYILSKGMGFGDEISNSFAKASKLHDIGKIGIPDNILFKKGLLNDEEWEIMKNHTLIGQSILSVYDSELLKLASIIAVTHHENYDGSGYPFGLIKKQIHIAGRLTAIADVFDALLSDRPYKKAWDLESAISYIQQESGKKFDPDIIAVFINEIEKITELYINKTSYQYGV